MVLKKRLGYGFNGFQVPFIPRAPRSARRRGSYKKINEDSQTCAFELLASVAGKLLQETESSSASSNPSEGNDQALFGKGILKQERIDEDEPLKEECAAYHGSCKESIFLSEVASKDISPKHLQHAETALHRTPVIKYCDFSKKVDADVKALNCKSEDALGDYSSRVAEAPQDFRESSGGNLENGFTGEEEAEGLGPLGTRVSTFANKCSLKDAMDVCVNSSPLIDSNSTTKSPFHGESIPNASFSEHGNDIILGCRDDDEKLLRCNKVSTKSRTFRHPQRVAHRRIRKLLTCKYWKAAPKLKDCELSRSDEGVKSLCHKRKTCYNFGRCQHDNVFKRRKFFDRSSVVTSDGGFSSESVTNSPDTGTSGNKSGSATILPGASGLSASVLGRQASFHTKDSHEMKFSIKSFRVPELYIEVPETATVGSLKRTVVEAVSAILGGGLRVGVLLHGKKVRDDNRTLLQTGISCKENLDTLGFTLEPNSIKASPPICSTDRSPLPSPEAPEPLPKSSESPVIDSGIPYSLPDSSLLTKTGNLVEDNHDSFSSHIDTITDKMTSDSRDLVTVPARSTDALAVVPTCQKTRRSDLAQRRTRRPFSVSEVEALVEAVEELGTGRWRDVKLRAFENADHRTYVDLKDKWKTLVHTAKISPQQRRGQPVPQQLLDRVLGAHAYWSQHHGKQNVKHQAGTPRNVEASTERLGVEGVAPIVMM
ncbi:Telomere repeat-binding protein [Quillaja saponaria]|uniref:Telomere repeat-binding protein n=1 Tax=Quillaja saponaria TaxID=32244 RepID=A0AAD7LUY8_QUISA|nr:Telomere repeat-binding protein [Quillaja saponaria]